MEEKGLVKRTRDSADRRVINIEILPAGQRLFALAMRRHEALITKLVSLLDPNEVKVLFRSYEKINKFADEESN
jgi:MarR family transcriptional regulator, organic hydroperoxide resistance regulator